MPHSHWRARADASPCGYTDFWFVNAFSLCTIALMKQILNETNFWMKQILLLPQNTQGAIGQQGLAIRLTYTTTASQAHPGGTYPYSI